MSYVDFEDIKKNPFYLPNLLTEEQEHIFSGIMPIDYSAIIEEYNLDKDFYNFLLKNISDPCCTINLPFIKVYLDVVERNIFTQLENENNTGIKSDLLIKINQLLSAISRLKYNKMYPIDRSQSDISPNFSIDLIRDLIKPKLIQLSDRIKQFEISESNDIAVTPFKATSTLVLLNEFGFIENLVKRLKEKNSYQVVSMARIISQFTGLNNDQVKRHFQANENDYWQTRTLYTKKAIDVVEKVLASEGLELTTKPKSGMPD